METINNNTDVVVAAAKVVETSKVELEGFGIYDMRSLSQHLPHKRKGLSKHFSGKSRSFACLVDAKRIEDLEKAELPEAKRRKYTESTTADDVDVAPFSFLQESI